jgi:hypothetical protein
MNKIEHLVKFHNGILNKKKLGLIDRLGIYEVP